MRCTALKHRSRRKSSTKRPTADVNKKWKDWWLWGNQEGAAAELWLRLRVVTSLTSILHQVTLHCRVNTCRPAVHMCRCAWGAASPFSTALSPQPRWPLPWGYNSTMQCLLNPVFKQLCEWVWRGETFPSVQTMEWSLCLHCCALQLTHNPHRLWMGMKHQVVTFCRATHRETERLAGQRSASKNQTRAGLGRETNNIPWWHTRKIYSHRNSGHPSPSPGPTPDEVKGHLWQSILGEISSPNLPAVTLPVGRSFTTKQRRSSSSLGLIKRNKADNPFALVKAKTDLGEAACFFFLLNCKL